MIDGSFLSIHSLNAALYRHLSLAIKLFCIGACNASNIDIALTQETFALNPR
jgi:hypothetical protein